jgi:hypothetical protein
LRDAIAAAISCPDYYEPYHKDNTIFMDMMLAQAKNPAMNAYIMAKYLINNGKNKKIRMLSISANDWNLTRNESFKDFKSNKYDYKVQPDSIITNTLMKQSLGKDYLRVSFLRPEKGNYGYLSVDELKKEAKEFYEKNKHLIEPMIQQIINERYNPNHKKPEKIVKSSNK